MYIYGMETNGMETNAITVKEQHTRGGTVTGIFRIGYTMTSINTTKSGGPLGMVFLF
jgi:hypothetical protein